MAESETMGVLRPPGTRINTDDCSSNRKLDTHRMIVQQQDLHRGRGGDHPRDVRFDGFDRVHAGGRAKLLLGSLCAGLQWRLLRYGGSKGMVL